MGGFGEKKNEKIRVERERRVPSWERWEKIFRGRNGESRGGGGFEQGPLGKKKQKKTLFFKKIKKETSLIRRSVSDLALKKKEPWKKKRTMHPPLGESDEVGRKGQKRVET